MNTSPKTRTRAVVAFALPIALSILVFGSLLYGKSSEAFEILQIDKGQGQNPSLDGPTGVLTATGKWQSTSTVDAPTGRYGHTAVWTGSEMIVWGGYNWSGFRNDGARYDPVSDTWTPITTQNAPSARLRHAAIWTGQEMIVWGGEAGGPDTNTGGRYDPATDSWIPLINLSDAPSPREMHSAIWTGSEMIVWGGCPTTDCHQVFNDGGRYNPRTDTWIPITGTESLTPRNFHQAVWTGDKMIIWGGASDPQGMSFDPETGIWTPINTTNAPDPTWQGAGVWSGEEMIVWGGCTEFSTAPCASYVNSGGRYNPATDTWTPVTKLDAPIARWAHTGIWTGQELIVWGGCSYDYLGSGGRYDPKTDTWTAVETTNAPSPRCNHKGVWSGESMVVWGGYDSTTWFTTGGRFKPADFALNVTPAEQVAYQGETVLFSIELTATTPGFAFPVVLDVGGIPDGTPFSIMPLGITPGITATLIVTTTGITPITSHELEITGVLADELERSTTTLLHVMARVLLPVVMKQGALR